MKKNTKRAFSLTTFLKLFLITSLTAGKKGDPQALMGFVPKEIIIKTINNVVTGSSIT